VPIHVGIIGGGNISETHARAAAAIDDVAVAGVYGDNREKAARLAAAHGARHHDTLDSLLSQPLDLVIIGSPSGCHAEHGIAAAGRGVHVLVEKPIDISTRRADALIDATDRAGVKLGVCFQDRMKPAIVRLKQFLGAGRLGSPILVDARVKWYRPPEYYSGSRWRGTWALDGGGAVINQAIHTLDLLLWLLGPVRRVYARAATALHRIEAEDTAVAVFEFANGALGTFEATTSAYPGYPRRVEITGREGTIVLEHDQVVAADLRSSDAATFETSERDTNPSASSPVVSDVAGHRKVIEDFIEAMRTGAEPRCSGREGRRSLALVEALYESSRRGQPVDVMPLT
jgi:predicted dehydrogenase